MLTKKRGCLLTIVCVFYAYTTKTYGLPSPDPIQGNKIESRPIPAPVPAQTQVQPIANTATQNVVAEGGVTINKNNNGTSLNSSTTESSTKLINATTESSSNLNVTLTKKHEGRENVPEFRSNYEEELSKKTTAKTQTLPPVFPPSTEASKIVPRKGAVFPNSTEVEVETKSSSSAENAQKSVVNTVNQEKSSSSSSSTTNVEQTPSTNVEKSTTTTVNAEKTSSAVNKLNNTTSTVVPEIKAAVNSSSTLNATVSTSETKLVTSSAVPSSSSTTTTTVKPTTTTTSKPRKPTVTIGSEDEPEGKENSIKAEKIPLNAHQTNTNFVVPIVAVILSVPLVAIVASVLYKKGSEWWQHRHYSRMDFLIDGMYNN